MCVSCVSFDICPNIYTKVNFVSWYLGLVYTNKSYRFFYQILCDTKYFASEKEKKEAKDYFTIGDCIVPWPSILRSKDSCALDLAANHR